MLGWRTFDVVLYLAPIDNDIIASVNGCGKWPSDENGLVYLSVSHCSVKPYQKRDHVVYFRTLSLKLFSPQTGLYKKDFFILPILFFTLVFF